MTIHTVFADCHCHPHKAFSSDGGNSRLEATLRVVDEIREHCVKHQIKSAICLGDIFHSRTATRFVWFNKVFECFSRFRRDGISLTIVCGNHDFVSKDHSVTTIDTFSEFAIVVKHPVFNDKLACLPYTPEFDPPVFSSTPILLAHVDIIGAKVTTGWICDKGFEADSFKGFKLVLSGHFHCRQQVRENICYVGTCCPQNFSEVGEYGYFLTLDDETAEIEWHYTSAPRFVVWDPVKIAFGKSGDASQLTGNYAKIIAELGHDKIMEKAGALRWIYEPPPRKPQVIQREKGISLDTDLKEVVKTYATVHAGELPVDKLIEVGNKLLG